MVQCGRYITRHRFWTVTSRILYKAESRGVRSRGVVSQLIGCMELMPSFCYMHMHTYPGSLYVRGKQASERRAVKSQKQDSEGDLIIAKASSPLIEYLRNMYTPLLH